MNTFLNQPEATFYHITTQESWTSIKKNGFISPDSKIFVSRVGELPVLFGIAICQLPEIEDTTGIIFLKFPQSRNNFLGTEIFPDNQSNPDLEWTQPFHNIISRKYIPPQNIELMMEINLGVDPERTRMLVFIDNIANQGRINYKNHSITERAKQINPYTPIDFDKLYY